MDACVAVDEDDLGGRMDPKLIRTFKQACHFQSAVACNRPSL